MADQKTPEEIAAEEAAKKAAEEAEKNKLKFSKEQRELIETLAKNAYEDGAKAVKEAMDKALEEERKQREAIAKQLEELTKKQDPPKQEPNKELESFRAQITEMQGVLTGIKTERDELKTKVATAEEASRKSRKKDKFLEAAKEAKIDFYDTLEAYDLAERAGYEWDKDADRPVIINKATGRPKLNENGAEMDVVDFVKHFADTKKYLVKAPDQAGGTGSGEQRDHRREEKPAKSFADMTDEEFAAYTQKVQSQQR